MFEKLLAMEERYDDINRRLSDPEIISDIAQYTALMKEHKTLSPIIEVFRRYAGAKNEIDESLALLDTETDPELRDMAQMQLESAKESCTELEQELKILLLPKDPNDEKNVIVEIRGGAGGEEASLFAGSLFRMYSMYAETHHWKMDILNARPTELGGYKEICFSLEGTGA